MSATVELPKGIKTLQQVPVDSKYFNIANQPYDDTAQVLSELVKGIRSIGLLVNVQGVEYWFNNGIEDIDLVLYATAGTPGPQGPIGPIGPQGDSVEGLPEELLIMTNVAGDYLTYLIDGVYKELDLTPYCGVPIDNSNEIARNGNDIFVTLNFTDTGTQTMYLLCLYNGKFVAGELTFESSSYVALSQPVVHSFMFHRGFIYLVTRTTPSFITKINPYDLTDVVVKQVTEGVGSIGDITAYKDMLYMAVGANIGDDLTLIRIDADLNVQATLTTLTSSSLFRTVGNLPIGIYNEEIYLPMYGTRVTSNASRLGVLVFGLDGTLKREKVINLTGPVSYPGQAPYPHWMGFFGGKVIITTIFTSNIFRLDAATLDLEQQVAMPSSVITDDNSIFRNGDIYLNCEYSTLMPTSQVDLIRVNYKTLNLPIVEISNLHGGKGSWGSLNPSSYKEVATVREALSLQEVTDIGERTTNSMTVYTDANDGEEVTHHADSIVYQRAEKEGTSSLTLALSGHLSGDNFLRVPILKDGDDKVIATSVNYIPADSEGNVNLPTKIPDLQSVTAIGAITTFPMTVYGVENNIKQSLIYGYSLITYYQEAEGLDPASLRIDFREVVSGNNILKIPAMSDKEVYLPLTVNNVEADRGGNIALPTQVFEATIDTGVKLAFSNVLGMTDPSIIPYTNNTFGADLTNVVLMGWNTRYISTAGKTEFPTLTGATYLETSPFEEGKFYYLRAYYNGNRIEYWFERISEIVDPVLVFKTTSTSSSWEAGITIGGIHPTVEWELTGGVVGTVVGNNPTFDLSTNTGEVTLTARNLAGIQGISLLSREVTFMNISNCENLKDLLCHDSYGLYTIDVTKNAKLETIYIYGTEISELDLSQNRILATLYLENNKLTTLNLDFNLYLTTVNAASNLISTVSISNNSYLTDINLENNLLTNIVLPQGNNLHSVTLSANALTTLNVFRTPRISALYIDYTMINGTDLDSVIIDLDINGFGTQDYAAVNSTRTPASDAAYNSIISRGGAIDEM